MRNLSSVLVLFPALIFAQPCTTNNASGCGCPDGKDTCYLLPDITISWQALEDYDNGPTEYSQTGNGADNGRLRITGCTPNIGWGPFTVRGTDYFICGNDTIYSTSGNVTCPDGSTPTNLLRQRIYKKMGATMTYEDRWAGGQTYHPTHGHNHVDDWVIFTLRVQDPNEPDTLKWPIIGTGSKLGFCLMDYGSCDYYNGYCRDVQAYGLGTVKTSSNTPNFGLGGGQYNCSPVEQGISVGYVDIYSESLDGMWINIPPATCNGNYWIVAEVDPRNSFYESNENNNWTAIPFTLTQQLPAGSATAEITIDGTSFICNGSSVTLQANPALSYLWSTGEQTASISVSTPGDYFVQVSSHCGQAVSDTVTIGEIHSAIIAFEEDTTCLSGSVELFALGTGTVNWYDDANGGTLLFTGNTYTTPLITNSTTYYAENVSGTPGITYFSEPHDYSGTNQYSQFNGHIIFDCLSPFTLKTVEVYTDYPGTRLIELRNSNGDVLADTSITIGAGLSRIALNFSVMPGTDYQLGTNSAVNQANFGSVSPQIRRSNTGVSYPYVIPDILSLNGSPYDNPSTQTYYYYYFYDWEIETPSSACVSTRQPVTATVAQPSGASFTGLDSLYEISNSPDTLSGTPPGGIFSGPGIAGNIFDPLQAGIGFHTITYSYTEPSGCFNEYSMTVHVRKGQITATATGDTEICAEQTTLLTASGGTLFDWSTGDTTASITVAPQVTTTYSVTVSDNFGSSDVAVVEVIVHPLPVVDFTGLEPEYFDTDTVVELSGTPAGGTFSGPGVENNQFNPAAAGAGGPYEIVYAYADQYGCRNAMSKQVLVKAGNVGVPVTIGTASILIYPNPTSALVHVAFSKADAS
ncbi:MAG TPA: lysyl oxidase family protein, partial [Chitinophagales bacterium]|nr:lysyl oxidase family protein [Chitinophagales bacterium]